MHICEVEDLCEASHIMLGDGNFGTHGGRKLETDDRHITGLFSLLFLGRSGRPL